MSNSGTPDPAAPVPFRLRLATEADQSAIRRMVRAARLNPTGISWRRFTVAEDGDHRLIGCAQLKPHRNEFVELASLVVQPEWRGRGVARSLIEQLKQETGPPLWLMCRSGLVPLYERFSFVEVLPDEAQPAYFRRVRRLASAFHMVVGRDEHLAVMVWRSD